MAGETDTQENPFADFKSEKAFDGIAAESAPAPKDEPKPGPNPEGTSTDPLAAFSDQGEDGHDDLSDAVDGDDGDGDGEPDDELDADAGGDDSGEEDAGDEDGDEAEDDDARRKPKVSAKKRIAALTKARRDAERRAEAVARELEEYKSGKRKPEAPAAPAKGGDAEDSPEIVARDSEGNVLPEPDPKNYKYGEVDTKYLKDVVTYSNAFARAQVEHEQEQIRQTQAAEQRVQELRESWDTVVENGLSRYDDFEKKVLAAGERGDYDLTQSTFEMAASSEYGAEIMYHLASNPKTASKVAKMGERDQARYLGRLEAAIETSLKGSKGKQRTAPRAAPPPARSPRGKGGRFVNPAKSGNFADFEAHINETQRKR